MSNTEHFRLIVRRGPQPNQIFELTQSDITIGRDIINDITISDPEVSRQHCQLTKSDDGYTITDNDSTNGTFINGERLYGSQLLNNGDSIGFGETVVISYAVTLLPSAKPSDKSPTDPARKEEPAAQSSTQVASSIQDADMATADTGQFETPELPPPPEYVLNPPGNTVTAPEAGRIVLFGCGVLTAVCLIAVFMGAILVDASDRWNDVPVVGDWFEGSPVPMRTHKGRHLEVKLPRDWAQGYAEFDDLTFVSAQPSTVKSDDLFEFTSDLQPPLVAMRFTIDVDERSIERVAESVFHDYYGDDFDMSQLAVSEIEIDGQMATRYSGKGSNRLTVAVLDNRSGRMVFVGAYSADNSAEDEEIIDYVLASIKFVD
jgi:pSer/pThr/pTyr-binding forkhead associated (FHA) protein